MRGIADATGQLLLAILIGVVLAIGLPAYSVIAFMRDGIEPPANIFEWVIVIGAGIVLAVIWIAWLALMWALSIGFIRDALTRLVNELNTVRTRPRANRGQKKDLPSSMWDQENPTADRPAGASNTTRTTTVMRILIAIARNLRTFAIYVLVLGTVAFLGVGRAGFTYWDALTGAAYFLGFAILVFVTLEWIFLVLTKGPIAGTKGFAAKWIGKMDRKDS